MLTGVDCYVDVSGERKEWRGTIAFAFTTVWRHLIRCHVWTRCYNYCWWQNKVSSLMYVFKAVYERKRSGVFFLNVVCGLGMWIAFNSFETDTFLEQVGFFYNNCPRAEGLLSETLICCTFVFWWRMLFYTNIPLC